MSDIILMLFMLFVIVLTNNNNENNILCFSMLVASVYENLYDFWTILSPSKKTNKFSVFFNVYNWLSKWKQL